MLADPSVLLAAGFLMMVLMLPIAGPLLYGRTPDPFGVPVLFSLFIGLGYLAPISSTLTGTGPFFNVWQYDFIDRRIAVLHAVTTAGISSIAFYVGYYLVRKKRNSLRRILSAHVWSTRRPAFWTAGATLYAVGSLSLGIVVVGSRFSWVSLWTDRVRVTEGYNYLFSGTYVLLASALVWLFRNLVTARPITAALCAYALFAVGVSMLLGNKSIVAVTLFAGAYLYHYLRRRVSWKFMIAAMTAGLTLTAAYDLATREYAVLGFVTSQDTSVSTLKFGGALISDHIDGNFMQLQMLSILIDSAPARLPLQLGRTYLALLYAPIPRSIFPSKPAPSTALVTSELWPATYERGTTIPLGIVGEFYLNFGDFGCVLGMAFFGAGFAGAERLACRARLNSVGVLGCSLLVASIPHYLRGDHFGPTIQLLIVLIPASVLCSQTLMRNSSGFARNEAAKRPVRGGAVG